MSGPRNRREAFEALILQASELGDFIERLGADFHGDEPGTRALVRFEEQLAAAFGALSFSLFSDDARAANIHDVSSPLL